MLSDEVIEKVTERLINRIEQGNEYILEQIGKKVKKIGSLSSTNAQQLIQIFKYGGDYEKIVKKLAKITKLNVKDIHKIFEEIAKNDLEFSKQFYKYRNKKFIPYNQNQELKRQVEAIANLTSQKYMELARSKALGYSIRDEKGNIITKGLKEVYDEAIDKAVLSVIQGKSTYQDQLYSMLKNIGESGLKTLDFGDRTMRLDSAIRMHVDDSIRQLHNETQKIIGEEFDSDGVEITVHLNPAPDHAEVQGRQFSNEEFEKFQNDIDCRSYDGRFFPSEFEGHDRRSISQYNCKHYTFAIILGVNIPQYSDKQLQDIIDNNNKGFDFEGKHYTNYEGTQLQRRIETEIRKQKDLQILAKSSGNDKLLYESQTKINLLNKKYKQLSKESGLLQKPDRLRVSGYKPVKVSEKPIFTDIDNSKHDRLSMSMSNNLSENEVFISKEDNERFANRYIKYYEKEKENHGIIASYQKERYENFIKEKENGFKDEVIKLDSIENCNKLLNKLNIEIYGDDIKDVDFKLVQSTTKQMYNLSQHSPSVMRQLDMNRFWIKAEKMNGPTAQFRMNQIELNKFEFKNYDDFIKMTKNQIDNNWWVKVSEGNEQYEVITHEFGHLLHREAKHNAIMYDENSKAFKYFAEKYGKDSEWNNTKYIPFENHKKVEKDFIYEPIRRLARKENLTEKEIINKYVSKYGISNGYEDMFAEMFTNSQLGESNALGDELIDFLIELGEWKK